MAAAGHDTGESSIWLYRGLEYDPFLHSRHIEVLKSTSRILCICAGRRWGKTFTAGLKFIDLFLDRLFAIADRVEAGLASPWPGLHMSRRQARRQLETAIQGVVVAPSQKHLDEIRGNLEARLYTSGACAYLHPDRHLAAHERPSEMWFVIGRAAGVIRFFVGSRAAQLVGSRASVLWLSECADLSDLVWRSVKPLMWEHKADVIAEGTPAFDEAHFFTTLAISGLPDGHERANRKLALRNEEVETHLATSLEAYSVTAREEAKKDVEASGEDSLYALQQIFGDWRMPSNYVFGWKPDRHLVTVMRSRGQWHIKAQNGDVFRITDRPIIMGGIDWFRGSAPAGAVVDAVWPINPLSPVDKETGQPVDPRPLVVALDEVSTEKGATYSDEDYIAKLVRLQQLWGVARWYQDPFSPKLTSLAKSRGLVIANTDPREKLGRLALLGRLLHCTSDIGPAFLCSTKCRVLAEQIEGYRWARKRDGTPTGKPIQYNDWLLDGQAYIMPHTGASLSSGGPL